jgi:transposase
MAERRRKFSPQFKAEAVQLVIETGKPIAEVARDLGVNDGTLGNWVKAWRDANPEPEPKLSPVERARIRELGDAAQARAGHHADGLAHAAALDCRHDSSTLRNHASRQYV